MNAMQILTDDLYAARQSFEDVLADTNMSFERELAFALQVLEANTYAQGVAQNNRQTLVNAFVNVSAIGLSLNPATKLAYLVPRKGGICLEVSYIGLVKLATDSGSVRWVKAELVYAADQFSLAGAGQPPVHTCNPFATDRGAIVGVYCVAKTSDGDYLTDTMTMAEVLDIRGRSESGKKGGGPWKTDFNEMAKKTIVKRAAKLWPHTDRLDAAIHHLNTHGGEGLAELAPAAPLASAFDLEAALAAAADANSRPELDAVFAEHGALATKAKDADGWKALKAACAERNRALAQPEGVPA